MSDISDTIRRTEQINQYITELLQSLNSTTGQIGPLDQTALRSGANITESLKFLTDETVKKLEEYRRKRYEDIDKFVTHIEDGRTIAPVKYQTIDSIEDPMSKVVSEKIYRCAIEYFNDDTTNTLWMENKKFGKLGPGEHKCIQFLAACGVRAGAIVPIATRGYVANTYLLWNHNDKMTCFREVKPMEVRRGDWGVWFKVVEERIVANHAFIVTNAQTGEGVSALPDEPLTLTRHWHLDNNGNARAAKLRGRNRSISLSPREVSQRPGVKFLRYTCPDIGGRELLHDPDSAFQ